MRRIVINFFVVLTFILLLWNCQKTNEPDATPPTVSITSPANNATVRDTVTIKVSATDNEGIKEVNFLVDGMSIGKVTKEPYQIDWNTKDFSNGSHTLICKATDNSNNTAQSEKVTVTVNNYLFKATFINNWLLEGEKGILIISDKDGNILGQKTWTGNDSFEIDYPGGLKKGRSGSLSTINVTTVTKTGITTNMDVPVGSDWTWKGYPYPDFNVVYSATLDFQNVPEHSGFVISTKWRSVMSSSVSLQLPYTYYFHNNPTNIYVKLNTTTGKKYLWVKNVSDGMTRNDDFTNMNPTDSSKIVLPESPYGSKTYFYGFTTAGKHYEGRYMLDYVKENGTKQEVEVHYPASDFPEFRTSISLYENSEHNSAWYQSAYGKIPSSFTKINADFDVVSATPDNFEISATGEFIQIRSTWRGQVFWTVYSSPNTQKYSLPQLPESVTNEFGFTTSDFKIWYVDILDFPELNSMTDIFNILFNSNNYFYDVVSMFRSKYKYPSTGLLKNGNNESNDLYEKQLPNY